MTLPILLALAASIIYAIYQIVDIMKRHNAMKKRAKAAVAVHYSTGKNQLLSPEFDNEVYQADTLPDPDESHDDFSKITQTIQDSFKVYDDYNRRMKEFYKTSKNEEPPDVIDITSLHSDNDNY